MAFNITILTLFPDMFPGPLAHSVVGRALEKGLWQLEVINIRDFATDRHKTVDDAPYGGGAGMVMRADVVAAAIRHAKGRNPEALVVFLAPTGKPFQHETSVELSQKDGVILLCGHYEGIDQRVLDALVDEEISVGDYVLSGGEIPAMVVADALLRHIPGVLGKQDSLHEESFMLEENGQKLLEYPHYTRPEIWESQAVPDILCSGHHKNIEKWRKIEALKRTKKHRPDLLAPSPQKT